MFTCQIVEARSSSWLMLFIFIFWNHQQLIKNKRLNTIKAQDLLERFFIIENLHYQNFNRLDSKESSIHA